jgi:hypothetical protein
VALAVIAAALSRSSVTTFVEGFVATAMGEAYKPHIIRST